MATHNSANQINSRRPAASGMCENRAFSPRRQFASGYFHIIAVPVFALCVLCISGCGTYEPTDAPVNVQPAAEPPPAVSEPAPAVVQKEPEQEPAAKGVGKKGRDYGQGAVATPIGSYFAMRERIAFEVQLPDAMNKFKALEGRPPKDHEGFMERIIKEYHIQLPELPDGHRYEYDPKTEQLMVLKPAGE